MSPRRPLPLVLPVSLLIRRLLFAIDACAGALAWSSALICSSCMRWGYACFDQRTSSDSHCRLMRDRIHRSINLVTLLLLVCGSTGRRLRAEVEEVTRYVGGLSSSVILSELSVSVAPTSMAAAFRKWKGDGEEHENDPVEASPKQSENRRQWPPRCCS